MTLRSLAQELTEPHLTMIGERIGRVPGLIAELREAVSGSTDTGAGGSPTKQRILVNANAIDLLNSIRVRVQAAYADRYGQAAPSLETCINTIGKSEHSQEWEDWFTRLFDTIKGEIETLLRPKKMRRLDGVSCPSCEQATYGDDRLTALYVDCWADHENLRPHQEWTVHCMACDATWAGVEQLKWVLVALTAKTG